MQGQHIRRLSELRSHTGEDRSSRDLSAPPGRAGLHTLAVGGLALLLLVASWGAWVWVTGLRPCALSWLVWR